MLFRLSLRGEGCEYMYAVGAHGSDPSKTPQRYEIGPV